jgi:hypothetical protein
MAIADMQVDLPYLSEELDRHGNQRLYVRRNGRRIRLRVARGSDGFLAAYSAALDSLTDLKPPSSAPSRRLPHAALRAGWHRFISAPRSSRSSLLGRPAGL